jgi:hypothetical protein
MINAHMRYYDYWLYEGADSYGQAKLSEDIKGSVKMSISVTAQSVQDNIRYAGAEYVGLTHAPVTDKYVIKYGEERLKVLYVNAVGRYTQVFMTRL